MIADSLKSEIEFALSNTGHSWEAGAATITDLLRVLHELMTKSGRDQSDIAAQVQTVLGSTTMHHLAQVIDANTQGLGHHQLADDCALYERILMICKQRSFSLEDGRHFMGHFLKALDEERTDADGNVESAAVLTYWAVGQEAAYHLGGLYVGDLLDIVSTELGGYLDPRLKRFHKIVEIWEMEMAWDKEDAA
jgi:hypothetical protein